MKNSTSVIELSVVEHSGVLVVDSRLIAEDLGIQHKNFLATLDKYIDEIEEDWGQVAFETETVTNSVGASNSVKYALLTEPQATLLMTYSRNTERVRQCKRHLVKAFEKAKLALSNAVELRVVELEQKIADQGKAITSLSFANAQLQSQIQNLLPPSADFIPPGWNEEQSMGLNPVIASVSLGSVRKFQIKPIGGKPTDFWLEHGSLLVMHPVCQSTHLHQVPKTKKLVSTRINLTFRPHIGGNK
ncbi:2OG-Fe(II) oxygenase [Calothrix sp. NIES-2100]|uniref:alpha-ketoglutarate-dependent dioxygenase AlkB n=1 Tax=Calothrix sp. NIES-2100 TaxID=1954172 RepID=UPI000B601F10|nr:2OG-Fe(II) oxygenase [Calothrix sp. NIES-2100]